MAKWRPKTIRRFVDGFPTSAFTARVETDVGPAYVKAMTGSLGEGPHTLASELIGTQLAHWFRLSTLEWSILVLDEVDEIPLLDVEKNPVGQAIMGPAFVTKAESGIPWSGGDRELKLLVNPEDISRLVVFDTWVLNCDRHSFPKSGESGRARIKRDNVFLSENAPAGHFRLMAMDHTHCFTCGRGWTKKLAHDDTMKDKRVFGLFPEFRQFLDRGVVKQAIADLRTITTKTVRGFVNQIPKDWDVTKQASEALVDLVVRRAAFVAETIETRLWPQRPLFPNDEEGSPEI